MNRREALKTVASVSITAMLLGRLGTEVTQTIQYDLARRATLQTFMNQVAPLVLFEVPTQENMNEWGRLLAAQFPGDTTAIVVADVNKPELHFNVTYKRDDGQSVLLVGRYESSLDSFVEASA